MKRYFYIGIVVLTTALPALALANEVVVFDKNNTDNVVSGTVTKVQGESVFVSSADREIEIELDELEISDVNDFFAPGMTVTARGEFSDDGHSPVLEADEIVRTDSNTALPVSAGAIILDNDNNN